VKRIGWIMIVVWLAVMALPTHAATPVVRAILFYSPTCPHCHEVMENVLPPLKAQYKEQLEIASINVLEPEGQSLYQAAVAQFQIPQERLGVPALIVGDQVLVGSQEIPDRFPTLIAEGLATGGIDWPKLPGFKPPSAAVLASSFAPRLSVGERLALDPAGNALAIVVLVGMIAVAGWVTYQGPKRAAPETTLPAWRQWATPVLALAGLGVAAYLSFVELTSTDAVCGPVGNCNAVQQSPYARLFGVLPVGLLGAIGYLAILGAWAVGRWAMGRTATWGRVAQAAFVAFGVLFSIYLTFLEPFVIGASCLWCLTSAILMTALLWLSWQPGLEAWFSLRRPPSRRDRRRRAQARATR